MLSLFGAEFYANLYVFSITLEILHLKSWDFKFK